MDKKISELRLDRYGVLILAIYRKINNKDIFLGTPQANTIIKEEDVLICYSREKDNHVLLKEETD